MTPEPLPAPSESLSAPAIGRPKRITLTDAQLFTVAALAAKGAVHPQIASFLGFSERSFRNVLERDERARTAYDQGRAQLYTTLVGELVARALDPKAPQSTIALIFACKCLLGFRDQGEPPAAPDTARLKIELTLPRALPLDKYSELVEVARRRLGPGTVEGAIETEGAPGG